MNIAAPWYVHRITVPSNVCDITSHNRHNRHTVTSHFVTQFVAREGRVPWVRSCLIPGSYHHQLIQRSRAGHYSGYQLGLLNLDIDLGTVRSCCWCSVFQPAQAEQVNYPNQICYVCAGSKTIPKRAPPATSYRVGWIDYTLFRECFT